MKIKDLKREDFSYTYDCYGYMIQYKKRNIGGAGVIGKPKMHYKHKQANCKDNIKYAEITIRDILDGREPRFHKEIKKIKEEANAKT